MSDTIAGSHDNSAGAVRLNPDVLSLIFNLNGDMFSNNDALKDTCHSSQVCRDWRDVILDTPSLWGKLIDMNVLTQEEDDWRNEVLRRSSNSPLSIRRSDSLRASSSRIAPPVDDTTTRWDGPGLAPWQRFFFSILDDHWSRFERLSVTINTPMADPQHWHAVYSPAPRLRVFEVHSSYRDNPIPPIGPIFANNAPFLEIFHARNIKLDIPMNASWLSTVRSIHIGLVFGPAETFDLLKMTPSLETLAVLHDLRLASWETVPRLPLLSFPRLRKIDLDAGITTCFTLLECINNIGTCSLRVRTSIGMKDGDLAAYLQVLSRVTQAYFTFHIPKAITLDIRSFGRNAFHFKLDDETSPDSTFSLVLFIGNGRMTPLLDALAIPAFNTITKLQLTLTGKFRGYDISSPTFFRSFLSVTVLHILGENIEYLLLAIQNSSQILFPLLEVVKLTCSPMEFDGRSIQSIHKLLQARKDVGHPVWVLDLTECGLLDIEAMQPGDFLEDMTGLKVLWCRPGLEGTLEYECGSGNPESYLS